MATAHDYNYPGHRFGVPVANDPHGGINPRIPPQPSPENPNVVRFTADICNSDVQDHTGVTVYRFESSDVHHLQMLDSSGSMIARFENGLVHFENENAVKIKQFIEYGRQGSTGAVLTYGGHQYEWLEELYYGVIRTTPENSRVAIIYNYSGTKPMVELVGQGIETPGLLPFFVFTTALVESGILKRRKGRIMNSLRSNFLGSKS